MKRLLLVPVFGLAVSGLASPAHAQLAGLLDGDRLNYAEARQPYYEARRIAYDNGYREGLKEGEKDGRRRDSYEFRDEGAWRNGDKGYNRSFGDRERYRVTFRTGFEAGYNDAYSRYAPSYGYGNGRAVPRTRPPYSTPYPNRGPGVYYPGQPGYGNGYGYSPAVSNGSHDGYEKGREDVRDGDRYDPARHGWYRSGDRHYRNEYGSRERYRDDYRQGFQEGYDRAFREYGYRR